MDTQTKNFLLSKGMVGGIALMVVAAVGFATKEMQLFDAIQTFALGLGLVGVRHKLGGLTAGRGNGGGLD